MLKEEFSCEIDDNWEPSNCVVNTGNDATGDIDSPSQPPLILLHGTDDTMTPYASGKAIYDQAQSVGLSSTLITIEGEGHMIEQAIFANYFDEMTTALYT